MRRHGSAVARLQRVEIALPSAQRRPFPDALCRKQGQDAVLEPGALLNQVVPLAVRTLGVLLLRCGHSHHAANLVITADIGSQHAQQALGVKPVGLGPACPAVHQDTRRLDNVGRHAVRRQQPVQPEAIPPRLEAADEVGGLISPVGRPRAQVADQCQQCRSVTGFDAVHPAPGGARQAGADKPHRSAELDGDVESILA